MKKSFILLIVITAAINTFALSGGPDQFGYIWKDSNEPGGPVYSWVDIVNNEREISGLGDDNNRGPFNMSVGGYNPFTFYWYPVDQFWVGSNGYISFGSINLASLFPNIPDSTDNKHNFIAGILADLTFTGAGNPAKCYYRVSPDSLIVSWINVPFYSSSYPYYAGSNTFQIILDKNDFSITVNFQTCSGTTLNTDIRTGIENITGNIGMQPFASSYPPNNYTIKYYYPSNPTYFVTDAAAKWNTHYGNGGVFLPYPTEFDLHANIMNTGNVDIPATYTATGIINNFYYVNQLTTTYNFNSILTSSDDTTFTYPNSFIPSATGIYSYMTTVSGVANDAFSTNNSVIQEIVVIDTSLTNFEMNFSDNVPDAPGLGWIGGEGGIGVYFIPPVYPVKVISTKYWIESNLSNAAFIAKIYDDDGPNGTAGTLLDSVMYTGTIFVGGYNTVPTSHDVIITNGGVYVLWEMFGVDITIARDVTPPISLRTFEYLSGIWADYRDSQIEDFLIGMNVERVAVEDIGVSSIVTPTNGSTISTPTTVSCWVKNYGTITESTFNIHYLQDGGTIVTEAYSGVPVASGDSVQFSFSQQLQPGSLPSGQLCVWTEMIDDYDEHNDTSCVNIFSTININELSEPSVRVYPNPFDEELTIELFHAGNAEYNIEILNSLGQTVRIDKHIVNKTYLMSRGMLKPGFYILRIYNEHLELKTGIIAK
jgi:hypothetical protein